MRQLVGQRNYQSDTKNDSLQEGCRFWEFTDDGGFILPQSGSKRYSPVVSDDYGSWQAQGY